MFELTGKKALITGSTQGIGKAIAATLVRCGAEVYVHGSSDSDKLKNVQAEINSFGRCFYDLKSNAPENLFNQTGDIDILVLNASVQYRTKWDEINGKEFDEQLNVNFKSTLELMQMYSPYMVNKRWGRILTIGSVQQVKPHKDMAVYAATKCAVMSLVKNISKQLAPFGVTVNNLSPGVIATPRNDNALSDDEYAKKVLEQIPAGYFGEAKDCAAAALLLCSEEGRYITGIDLTVDGGMSL